MYIITKTQLQLQTKPYLKTLYFLLIAYHPNFSPYTPISIRSTPYGSIYLSRIRQSSHLCLYHSNRSKSFEVPRDRLHSGHLSEAGNSPECLTKQFRTNDPHNCSQQLEADSNATRTSNRRLKPPDEECLASRSPD